jgi:hypothetical protein
LKSPRGRLLAILLTALTPLLIRALALPWFPIPAPRIHDEFSHLLIADTFAHGRLVNPAHPLWIAFDSMQILAQPIYASHYPPAQGAILALAQLATGQPWWGVWLSIGLMCGAICWMLQGWTSPRWALIGAILTAARFGVTSYWMNSYYGGAIPAFAGALVLGAIPRIIRTRRKRDAAILALGIAILANSRPYEGLIFALCACSFLLWNLRRDLFTRRILLPAAAVLAPALLLTLTYFTAFTGSPFTMPYSYFREHFTQAPHFIFQQPRPEPVYYHRATREYYAGWEMRSYQAARDNQPPRSFLDKAKSYSRFYFGPALALAVIASLVGWRRARIRFLWITFAVMSGALAVEVWHAPHYAAPITGAVALLAVEGLRHIALLPRGKWIAGALCLASLAFPVQGGFHVGDGQDRREIIQGLTATGQRHLILVRYARNHDPGDEWVYNGADIDNSPVVFAREMDPGSNRRLLDYFKGRRVWLIQPDVKPIRLRPYDPEQLPDPPFAFVKLDAAPIDALQSSEVRWVLGAYAFQTYSCDGWNRLFLDNLQIEPPEPSHGCFTPDARTKPVSFDYWLSWLETQQ